MIDWLERTDPDKPFLIADEGVWTYGDVLAEVRRRLQDDSRLVRPRLDPGSVFEILAGLAGGGAMVSDRDIDLEASDTEGAALVVFTSGSTGTPRGVRLTTENLEAASRASVEHLGHSGTDTWLLVLPLTHVGGLSILVRSAYAGGSVRMLPEFDPERVAEVLAGEVTLVSVVPTMLRRLLDHRPGPYSGLAAVLVGGGPIPDGLLEEASAAGLPVLPTYGMTETFGQVATLRPGAVLKHHAHPLPGVQLRISESGRIEVRGGQVSPGYLGEPDRSSEWLITSDLGLIDEEGAVQVLGRADNTIVSGGENIDPHQIEAKIGEHPDVSEVVVVGLPDSEWGMVVACIFSGDISSEALARWAGDRLYGPSKPKRWSRVDAIPRTALGKPDRPAAARLF